MKTTYRFVAHGNTFAWLPERNDDERPLSKLGIAQTLALREWLITNSTRIDLVYYSGTGRSYQTVQIVLGNSKLPFEPLLELNNFPPGSLKGTILDWAHDEDGGNMGDSPKTYLEQEPLVRHAYFELATIAARKLEEKVKQVTPHDDERVIAVFADNVTIQFICMKLFTRRQPLLEEIVLGECDQLIITVDEAGEGEIIHIPLAKTPAVLAVLEEEIRNL